MTLKPLTILIDTNVFIAQLDENDTTHTQVIAISKKIPESSILYTTTQIMSESLTVAAQKLGKKTAINLLKELLPGDVTIIHIDELIFNKSLSLFKTITSKNVSFADCTSFVVLKQYSIDAVFTFDQHFKKQGFKLLNDLI